MKRTSAAACLRLLLLGTACGTAGSTPPPTTGTGTTTGTETTTSTGSSGAGGGGADASAIADTGPDRAVVTCENRDGNACTIPPAAQGCQRCVSSCCCTQVDACRANAECAAGLTVFNDCVGRGEPGVVCLVSAIEAAGGRSDLFAEIADCLDIECDIISCRL